MIIYRLALTEFCDASGEGARIYGGRWNLPGAPAIYASSSIASSLLERLTIDSELFSSDRFFKYSVMEITVPDRLINNPSINKLPKKWDAIPPMRITQEYGTDLLKDGVLCFAVPSVVDKTSLNYVVNSLAEDFQLISYKVYPLNLEQRIFR